MFSLEECFAFKGLVYTSKPFAKSSMPHAGWNKQQVLNRLVLLNNPEGDLWIRKAGFHSGLAGAYAEVSVLLIPGSLGDLKECQL